MSCRLTKRLTMNVYQSTHAASHEFQWQQYAYILLYGYRDQGF